MPQFTSPLTINDGSATPVAVSYSVEKLSSEHSVLVDRRKASRELQPTLTITFDRATAARKTYKVKHNIAMPIVRADANGVDRVVDIARANVEYVIPPSMTAQERKDLRALTSNAQSQVSLKEAVDSLDPLY